MQNSLSFGTKPFIMIKIIADDKVPFLKGVLEPFADVRYMPGGRIRNDDVRDADALIIRTRTRCNATLLDHSAVKFIATATIGFDHIDADYCSSHGIEWTSAPGCNASSVQQYVASALMRISGESGFSLKGKTLGVIGAGNAGSRVAEFAGAMGMNVLLNDPPRQRAENSNIFTDLKDLLAASDIITLHVPLNRSGEDRTFHLFDRQMFETVRKGAWMINASRGEVVDTESLKDTLYKEKLAGVVLDVWENEPEIDRHLMEMAFLATPHIAGYSTDGKINGTAMSVRALSRFFGLPLNDWYPSGIPSPAEPLISLNTKGKSDEELIRRAVFHSYYIVEDDARLRFNPSSFEKLRGDYPVRREFPAFKIFLNGGHPGLADVLARLGFGLTSSI